MSLADELLNDYEECDEDDLMLVDAIKKEIKTENGIFDDDLLFKVPLPVKPKAKLNDVRQVAKLWESPRLKEIRVQLEKSFNQSHKMEPKATLENDSEYKLIVEANNIFVDVDDELGIIHKFVKEIYAKRFPELESLVGNPLEYLNAVRELGNDVDKVKNSETLAQILTQATIMVVSVTASTTQGTLLTEREMEVIEEACQMAYQLNSFKLKIFEYVESRMNFIAPNLSSVVGASTAAKLMGAAGGLSPLAKMPADHVLHIGKQTKTHIGMSHSAMLPHAGVIYYCDFVQQVNQDLRKKAARLASAKAALAARVDCMQVSPDGSQGKLFRDDIEKKMDKLQEPPPFKFVKPLPAPIDAPGKKRGGKRVRKLKERLAVTDFRKAHNRMNFGEIEDDAYQNDLGYTRGQVGKGGAGRVRKVTMDEKTRVRLSKTLQKEVHRQNTYGGATTVKRQITGTASSVAFTPLQGLEIVNPQAAEKNSAMAYQRYFSNVQGFRNVNK